MKRDSAPSSQSQRAHEVTDSVKMPSDFAIPPAMDAVVRGYDTSPRDLNLHEVSQALLEARDEKRLLRLQRQLAAYKLLIIDELGYVPLSPTGAELLFEVFSQRYERGSTLVTSNLPFDEWTSVFGSERLTGALLDRLTHHVHILEMNGDSYRLAHSKRRSRRPKAEPPSDDPGQV